MSDQKKCVGKNKEYQPTGKQTQACECKNEQLLNMLIKTSRNGFAQW